MNESVAPDAAARSGGDTASAPAAAPKYAIAGDATVGAGETGRGSSTYATGGGGVSFAHRVAAVYIAGMLTGARRVVRPWQGLRRGRAGPCARTVRRWHRRCPGGTPGDGKVGLGRV